MNNSYISLNMLKLKMYIPPSHGMFENTDIAINAPQKKKKTSKFVQKYTYAPMYACQRFLKYIYITHKIKKRIFKNTAIGNFTKLKQSYDIKSEHNDCILSNKHEKIK